MLKWATGVLAAALCPARRGCRRLAAAPSDFLDRPMTPAMNALSIVAFFVLWAASLVGFFLILHCP
jgi:hypothetical protein